MSHVVAGLLRGPLPRALCVIVLATLAGCGSDDGRGRTGPEGSTKLPPRIVRDDAIKRQKRGSPARALLAWWQAAQFTDVPAVKRLTARSLIADFGERRFTRVIEGAGAGLGGLRPLRTSIDGDDATVRAAIITYKPGKTSPSQVVPTSFEMVRDNNGRWRFASERYLTALGRGQRSS